MVFRLIRCAPSMILRCARLRSVPIKGHGEVETGGRMGREEARQCPRRGDGLQVTANLPVKRGGKIAPGFALRFTPAPVYLDKQGGDVYHSSASRSPTNDPWMHCPASVHPKVSPLSMVKGGRARTHPTCCESMANDMSPRSKVWSFLGQQINYTRPCLGHHRDGQLARAWPDLGSGQPH